MIGLLTFHWADDYGAMLQAYALKYHLEKASGKQVEIIPYAPVKLTGRYWLCPVIAKRVDGRIKYGFYSYTLKRNLSVARKFLKRKWNMHSFRRQYLTGRPARRKVSRLSLKKYSCVFVGSDQVWNPEITVGLDDAYMGNIKGRENCRLVSYGASFGGDTIPEEYRPRFTELVRENFAAVSLREQSAVPFVKHLIQKPVTDLLDPTLLLEREEWEVLGKRPQSRDYILFTFAEYNQQMIQYVQELSARLHKRVIQTSLPWLGENAEWIDVQMEGGPADFIGYFQNAYCVVTNSFHGMVFSVLLEKQFLVFGHSNKNARIENFLKKLGLESRLVDTEKPEIKKDVLDEIDWKNVKKRLYKEKEASISFIRRNCLECGETGYA